MMRAIDTDWEWRNPQDIELEGHRPRRRQPAARRPPRRRQRPALLPTLTLLAAAGAAALSVVDLVIEHVGNEPAQVMAWPPAETTVPPAAPVDAQVLDAPPIERTDHRESDVDECRNPPLTRGRQLPC